MNALKIVFYPVSCLPFHGKTLEEKPMGGLEAAVIHFSEALAQLGHEVIILSHLKPEVLFNSQLKHLPPSKAKYIHVKQGKDLTNIDLFVVVRGFEGLSFPIKARKTFLWTGDSSTNIHTIGLGDPRIFKQMDGVFFVSDWQRETMCEASGLPLAKAFILRNGVHLGDFLGEEKRMRKRLIYASNPQRGLIHLPGIYLNLKRFHPELELHLFCNAALFDMTWPPKIARDIPHEALLNLIGSIPGCFVHGTILQMQLARELMKSAILTYPCHIPETSCMVALEAQAAGCAIVTSSIGGLPETVGEAGILVNGDPTSEAYLKTFTEALDQLLKDDSLFKQLSEAGKKRSLSSDWKNRALEWLDFLKNHFDME
jgi:glycosyltransferase involved in cell wall biosynthesis